MYNVLLLGNATMNKNDKRIWNQGEKKGNIIEK
jgi:hypothetical protein